MSTRKASIQVFRCLWLYGGLSLILFLGACNHLRNSGEVQNTSEAELSVADSLNPGYTDSANLCLKTEHLEYLAAHLDRKHEILEQAGRYQEAYQVLIQSRTISDSLFSIEKRKEIAIVQEKYESSKRETENILVKKDLEVKDSKILLMWTGITGVAFFFWWFWSFSGSDISK